MQRPRIEKQLRNIQRRRHVLELVVTISTKWWGHFRLTLGPASVNFLLSDIKTQITWERIQVSFFRTFFKGFRCFRQTRSNSLLAVQTT